MLDRAALALEPLERECELKRVARKERRTRLTGRSNGCQYAPRLYFPRAGTSLDRAGNIDYARSVSKGFSNPSTLHSASAPSVQPPTL